MQRKQFRGEPVPTTRWTPPIQTPHQQPGPEETPKGEANAAAALATVLDEVVAYYRREYGPDTGFVQTLTDHVDHGKQLIVAGKTERVGVIIAGLHALVRQHTDEEIRYNTALKDTLHAWQNTV